MTGSIIKKVFKLFVKLYIVILFTPPAYADAISVDYIRGEGDVEGIKLAYHFYEIKLPEISPDLHVFFETSANFWEYGTERQHETNLVLAISPVLQKTFCHCLNGKIYGEFGIGISFIDDTQFAGKNISTHYQFEDRIGVGYQFGPALRYRMSVRYFHYSNGGIEKPNPGLDFVSLSFMVRI